MTRTEKNINEFVNNTIKGFNDSIEIGMKYGWTYEDYCSIEGDYVLHCRGAIIFAEIYENSITVEIANELRKKLNLAYLEARKEFARRELNK